MHTWRVVNVVQTLLSVGGRIGLSRITRLCVSSIAFTFPWCCVCVCLQDLLTSSRDAATLAQEKSSLQDSLSSLKKQLSSKSSELQELTDSLDALKQQNSVSDVTLRLPSSKNNNRLHVYLLLCQPFSFSSILIVITPLFKDHSVLLQNLCYV